MWGRRMCNVEGAASSRGRSHRRVAPHSSCRAAVASDYCILMCTVSFLRGATFLMFPLPPWPRCSDQWRVDTSTLTPPTCLFFVAPQVIVDFSATWCVSGSQHGMIHASATLSCCCCCCQSCIIHPCSHTRPWLPISCHRCGPCQMIGPYFGQLSEAYDGKLIFVKIDVDANNVRRHMHCIANILWNAAGVLLCCACAAATYQPTGCTAPRQQNIAGGRRCLWCVCNAHVYGFQGRRQGR